MSRDGRYLSRILRHAPQEIGVTLDAHGWLHINELLAALKRARRPISRAELAVIVAADAKQRFTLSVDGERIRAAQGFYPCRSQPRARSAARNPVSRHIAPQSRCDLRGRPPTGPPPASASVG